MRFPFPALVFLAPGLLHAAESETLTVSPQQRSIPAISLLPDGSILSKVMLPRYDKTRKLTSVLKAEEMILVNADQIFGTTVSMELYDDARTPTGRMDLTKALFDQKRGILEANQPVTIVSDRMVATGAGLVYALDQNRGFLLGPATTRISKPPATAMNPPSPAFRATALLGAAFLPLTAAPPPAPVTPEQKATIEQDAVSQAAKISAENKNARTDLREILKASDDANKAANEFLTQSDLLSPAATPVPTPEARPLEVKPDPEMTLITCDGGIYFDPAANVLVYLKNVTVSDPRFDIKGANELKVFFDKKAPKEGDKPKTAADADPKKPAKKDSLSFGGGGDFGDPRRVVATGAVVLTQKAQDNQPPVQASGATFSFDLLTGDKIIQGGYPWVMQGPNFFRANKPNLILRIDKDFHFVTEGDWTTGMKLNTTKEKPKQ